PRSSREDTIWAAHAIAGADSDPAAAQYETDRARFVGRGGSLRQPQAIVSGRPLENTAGNVLDPIFSLRTTVTVPPRGRASVTFITFAGDSREHALALVARYRNPAMFAHVLQSAWTFARTELHHLGSGLAEARLFQSLAAHLLYGTAQMRAAERLDWDTPDVTHLWRHAISGDRPILLIRCHNLDELGFVRQCLRAQEYLRSKQIAIDVVMLNERQHSYMQDLQQALVHTAADFRGGEVEGELRGGIFVLSVDALSAPELQLLMSLARVTLHASQGSLKEQLWRPPVTRTAGLPSGLPAPVRLLPSPAAAASENRQLEFFNGFGGFDAERDEYCIRLHPGAPATPAPWSNILANESFGALVTERG